MEEGVGLSLCCPPRRANEFPVKRAHSCNRTLLVFVIAAASLSHPQNAPTSLHAATAINQLQPGKGIGSLQLGMTANEVRRLWGPPAQIAGQVWIYGAPLKARVTFLDDRVASIDTWDPSVRTPSGVGIGMPEPEAVGLLGKAYRTEPVQPGYWLKYQELGFALYIDKGVVAALAVFAPGAPAVQPTPPSTPPRGPQTTGPQTNPAKNQPLLAPRIKIESIYYLLKISSWSRQAGFVISGSVRNTAQEATTNVVLEIEAQARGSTYRQQVRISDAIYYGSTASFESGIYDRIVDKYTIRVVSYDTYRGEPLHTVTGSIPITFFQNALREGRPRCEGSCRLVVREGLRLPPERRGQGWLNVSISWTCPVVPFFEVKAVTAASRVSFFYVDGGTNRFPTVDRRISPGSVWSDLHLFDSAWYLSHRVEAWIVKVECVPTIEAP